MRILPFSETINSSGNSVNLRFDRPSNASANDIQMMLRILYWCCYLGKIEIVERLIRLGFSPFLASYKNKSPFMAAIEGQ